MSVNEEWIDVRLQLRDAQRFIAQTTEAGGSVSRLGTETEVAGAKARKGGLGFDMFGRKARESAPTGMLSRIKGIGGSYFHAAKGILAAGAAFASYEGAKKAIQSTDDLAQTTLRLTKNTAFDTETASQWAAVAKVRGIDSNRLGQTLAKLSKQVEGGLHGQKASVDLWNSLGISQQDLMNSSKDMPGFLGIIADRFKQMGPGTARTTAAQSLFGRSWQTLIPILRDGSGALNDQLGLAKKYGADLGESGTKTVEGFIQKQREMQFATLGLQVSFAKFLIPALVWVISKFNLAVLWFRKHHEITDVLKGSLKGLGFVLGTIATLIGSNTVSARLFGVALVFLIGLAIAGKFVKWGKALYDTAKALKVVTAAQWLWNVAMSANPIVLIIIAIVAIGVALVVAYKKVAWFRNAVNAAWKWIKGAFGEAVNFIKHHWMLLLTVLTGGIAGPVLFIVKHWNTIKKVGAGAVHFIVGSWKVGIHFIVGLFKGIGHTASSMWHGVVAGGKAAINAVIDVFNVGIGAINAITPGNIDVGPIHIPGIPDIPKIPHLWKGGTIRTPGMALVGDRGPELLTLPAGAKVDPLPDKSSTTSSQSLSDRFAQKAARHLNLTIPVMVNGREIGRANSRYTDDEEARG